jgi:hypothetical protein
MGDVAPLDQFSRVDIAAYGADSVSELLANIERELGDVQGGLIVLVNGRKVASLSEVTDLPTESIRQVEVLPDRVALRYGGSLGQKVINFVLLPEFRSGTARVASGLATEGGAGDGEASFSLTRIRGANRLSVGGRAYIASRLLESERDVGPRAAAPFRSLRPEQRRYSLNGSLARELGSHVTGSVNITANYETSHAINGLPTATQPLTGVARHSPLEQRIRGVGGSLAANLNADLGPWSLSVTGQYGQRRTRTLTDRELLQSGVMAEQSDRLTDRAPSSSHTGGVAIVASGPLFAVPAGNARLSLRADLTRSSLVARLTRAGVVTRESRDRTDTDGWVTVEIPISSRQSHLGELSAHVDAGLRSLSDLRTLRSLGGGLDWSPRTGLTLTASIKDYRHPPSLPQLASPRITTSGVRLFDYAIGQTVEVTHVTGGNSALRPDRQRTLQLGANLVPFGPGKLRLTADYRRVRASDSIAALPAATAAIQTAFPERFVRDSSGALIAIDSRLVNFARERSDRLRWGFVLRRSRNSAAQQAEEANGAMGTGYRIALFHDWFFKDEVLPHRDLPVIDRLHGGAAAKGGGQPRHQLQWEVGANSAGLGARLLGSWRSGTTVHGGHDTLRFSPLATLDLKLFADVGEHLSAETWARGLRISLSVVNLRNDRQKVRDARGGTPLSYQPAYFDPLGRMIEFQLRKLI